MRIVIAAPVSKRPEGGVANVVYNTASALRARGHQVECLFLEDVTPEPAPIARFQALSFSLQLARILRRRRDDFDVANIHAPGGLAYGLMRRYGPADGLPPYVMLLHGIEERRNHVMRREAAKGRAPQFLWKNRLWQHAYYMQLFRAAIVTADQAVVINRETWTTLQLKYGCENDRVWYVPNGVEPHFFVPRAAPHDGPARLLFVGTWLEHKGVYYLRQAFEALAQRYPGLRLTIAGCAVDAQTIANSFHPAARDRLDILPFVPRSEMPDLYAGHDIFLFPSLFEGLPIVLLEAMASGLAVVTSDSCGMKDVVEDGHNGLLVKPAHTDDLVAAAGRLIASPELRTHLGLSAQETARRYTWERVAEQLENVFARATATA